MLGPLPDLSEIAADASPLGTAVERSAWERIDRESRHEVSRVFANIGKAIAAYERTLRYGESPFDRYAHGVVRNDAQAQ